MTKINISTRLKKSQKKETRREFAHEWADAWEQRYIYLIILLQNAIQGGADDDTIRNIMGDLRGLHEPHFRALHNVIDELIDPTRELL